MKESDLVKSCLQYLEIKRIFNWRNNSGAMFTERNGKKGFYRFGDKGSPDIFAVKDSKIYGLECKVGKNKLSEFQKDWKQRFEKAGGIYLEIRDLDELQKYFC